MNHEVPVPAEMMGLTPITEAPAPVTKPRQNTLRGLKARLAIGTFAAAELAGALTGSSAQAGGFVAESGSSASCQLPEAEIQELIDGGGLAIIDPYNPNENVMGEAQSAQPLLDVVKPVLPDCPPASGEVVKDEVQKDLDAWLTKGPDGKWLVESTPKRFIAADDFQILNLLPYQGIDTDFKNNPTGYRMQAELITYEIVNGKIIIYLGFEDWGPKSSSESVLNRENDRIYVATTYGLNKERFGQYSFISNIDAALSAVSDSYFISNNDLYSTHLPKEKGNVFLTTISPYKVNPKKYTGEYREVAKYINQSYKSSQDLVRFLYTAANEDPAKRKQFSEIEIGANILPFVNQRVTPELVASNQIPSIQGFITQDKN